MKQVTPHREAQSPRKTSSKLSGEFCLYYRPGALSVERGKMQILIKMPKMLKSASFISKFSPGLAGKLSLNPSQTPRPHHSYSAESKQTLGFNFFFHFPPYKAQMSWTRGKLIIARFLSAWSRCKC